MADTLRSLAYFLEAIVDNTQGLIAAQHLRDLSVSLLSFQAGLAAAGTTKDDAAALTSRWNIVTTVASGSGVRLTAGISTTVSNRGANLLAVYPPSGGQIEGLGVDAPLMIAPGHDVSIAFDPANQNKVYAMATLNLANLATTQPSAAGIPWSDGGLIAISQP